MNDHHLDPPEEPELPECCDDVMDCDDDGKCTCPTCGKVIEPHEEPDMPDDSYEDFDYPEQDQPAKCPHGERWGDCGTCDHESDIAYDASREM
jgi:hypothetical protein